MSALAIDVRGLTKRFGRKVAVNGIDIAVPEGQVWGFLGPNGSGKTTTIRMLCGLLRADAGEGTCLGYDFRTQSEQIKREVGYMTQKFSFWEDLSIRENLDFVARVYELPDARGAVDGTPRTAGPDRTPEPAGRRTVRRLEAATGARRLHAALAEACCCSTNRRPASIPRRGAISGTRSIA